MPHSESVFAVILHWDRGTDCWVSIHSGIVTLGEHGERLDKTDG